MIFVVSTPTLSKLNNCNFQVSMHHHIPGIDSAKDEHRNGLMHATVSKTTRGPNSLTLFCTIYQQKVQSFIRSLMAREKEKDERCKDEKGDNN